MKSVMFSFGDAATEELQDHALSEIRALPGVRNVGRISPQAKKAELRRLCFAEVDDSAADAIVGEVRAIDGVQSADLPAPRGLV